MADRKTKDGRSIVVLWPTEGTRTTEVTPNWCDKTTWYYRAIRVVDEPAVCQDSGSWTTYQVASGSLIDSYHGKFNLEDSLKDSEGNSFRVIVKVDGAQKTEQDPHYGSGGDYTINYHSGSIHFLTPLSGGANVQVTYHYATTSEWAIKPLPGKSLKLRRVECQFSEDLVITDSVRFQLYVGGYPYGDPITYKTMRDYINESNGSFPVIPAVGGNGWRGLNQNVHSYAWDYAAMTELKSSVGMEIRIKLEHDVPFQGLTATATFYCLSEIETT